MYVKFANGLIILFRNAILLIRCPFIFLQPNKNKIANKFTAVKTNNRIKFPYRDKYKSRCKCLLRSS